MHRPGAQVGVGAEPGHAPWRGPRRPRCRWTSRRTGASRCRGRGTPTPLRRRGPQQHRAGSAGEARRRATTPAKASLSMPSAAPRHARTGVGDAGEVEGALQRAVLPGPPWQQLTTTSTASGRAPAQPARARRRSPRRRPRSRAAAASARRAARPSTKSAASSVGVDAEPVAPSWSSTAPVTSRPAPAELACRLQAGEDADVVLGGRAPEDDGDLGGADVQRAVLPSSADSAGTPRGQAVRAGSRVVVGQVVLVQHDVALARGGRGPTPSPAGASAPPRSGPAPAPSARCAGPRAAGPGGWSGRPPPGRWRPRRRPGRTRRSRRPGAARARPCPASPPPAAPASPPSRSSAARAARAPAGLAL